MHPHKSSSKLSLKRTTLALLFLALLACVQPAHAQDGEPPLSFGLSKDFGYALGSSIQGTFSVHVTEEESLTQIALLIDGQQIDIDDEPPFRIRFSTSDFTPGTHSISVIGITTDGQEISSQAISVDFLSAEQARSQTINLIVPLLGIVLVIMVLSTLAPVLLGRGKRRFQPGSYGAAGGAICPRCELPFSRNYFSLNLLVGKLERCPHCGKWSIVRRASNTDLEAAEARYLATMEPGALQQEDEESHLRRMIDDSRYESSE
jgi:hypothetical protein